MKEQKVAELPEEGATRRILVVGDPDSIWILNFTAYILAADPRNKIDILCATAASHRWKKQYADLHVQLIEFPENVVRLREKEHKTMAEKLKIIYLCGQYIGRLKGYNIINMQYVSPLSLLYFWKTAGTEERLILSYWGSDLMRMSLKGEKVEKFFLKYKKCAYVTFDNGDLEDLFERKFRAVHPKGRVLMLNLPVLDWIDKTKREDCKIIGGRDIPEDKIVAAIGYNGRQEQQHIKVIRELWKLRKEVKKELLLFLQMTYGGTREYIEACEKACRDGGLEYVLFQEFQMYGETAQVRRRTDIFINAQTTDAFSGSFCEYMFADTMVLNAQWLHYRELNEHPFVYGEFKQFGEIPLLMDKEIEEIHEKGRDRKIGENREIIWRLRSNENCRKQWRQVFDRIESG